MTSSDVVWPWHLLIRDSGPQYWQTRLNRYTQPMIELAKEAMAGEMLRYVVSMRTAFGAEVPYVDNVTADTINRMGGWEAMRDRIDGRVKGTWNEFVATFLMAARDFGLKGKTDKPPILSDWEARKHRTSFWWGDMNDPIEVGV